jgi:hypothetical protein
MGQVIASAGDLLRFARAHLGAQATPAAGAQGGAPLLAPETLARMQAPLGPGGTLAGKDLDGIGAAWELRTVGGVRVAQKGGRLPGSEALLLLVPERAFALTVQTNAVGGYALADEVAGRALGHYLGLAEPPITPAPLPADRLRPYAGRYVSPGERAFEVTAADGGLLLQRVPLGEPGQPGEPGPGRLAPPARLAFYGPDRVVGLEGAEQHARHDFVRRPDGGLGWLRYGGRLCARQGRAD